MTTASIQIAGPDAEQSAEGLRRILNEERTGAASAPQTLKSDEIITIISLALGAFSPAKAIWDWWQARKSTGTRIKILLPDGVELDLAVSNLEELQLKLDDQAETTN